MTNILLEKSLVKLIEEKLDDIEYFKAEEGKMVNSKINIRRGFLPLDWQQESIFPYILVRTKSVQDTQIERNIQISISIGVWHTELEDGYDLLTTTNNRVLDELIKKGMIGDYFSLNPECEWKIIGESSYPYWTSEINLSFRGSRPEKIINY